MRSWRKIRQKDHMSLDRGKIEMYWQDDYSKENPGCCLNCNDEWKNDHLTNEEDGDYFTCLCRECKCRQCLWYEPLYEEDFSEGGECTHPQKRKFISRILFSNLKIKNVVNVTDKSYLCQIGLSDFIFVPKSVVNNEGFVKKWFVYKKIPKESRIDLEV
jgi:hypothetical protein